MFIWILFKLGLDWEQAARRKVEDLLEKVHRTLHRTLLSSVRSMKKGQAVLTGPCLRPVKDHRTRPVAIPEDLDLSGIDRTLGGSVRSLPPERPVSGSQAS